MASVSALLLAEPIIPLQSGFVAEDLSTVKVENSYTPPNSFSRITKKAHLPTVSEPKDKELIIYVVDQFVYHCSDEQLHLNDGPLRYSKFCDVVKGDLLIAWQKISNARANKTIETFVADINEFFLVYLKPSSYLDQQEYMRRAIKPYNMDCETLGSRLRVISQLSVYLPGSNSNCLYANEDELKRAYLGMMPGTWKVHFLQSGAILDGAYPYLDLIHYLGVQEALSKRMDRQRRMDRPTGGRGGNRFGRTRGGRGRGRYRSGPYHPYGGSITYGSSSSHGPRSYGGYGGSVTSYSSPGRGSAAGYNTPRPYNSYGRGISYGGGSSGHGFSGTPGRSPYTGRFTSSQGRGPAVRPRPGNTGGGRFSGGGNAPSLPTLYTGQQRQDHYFHQGGGAPPNHGVHDHYSHGQDHYYSQEQDHYFQEEEQYYPQEQDHFYQEEHHDQHNEEDQFDGDETGPHSEVKMEEMKNNILIMKKMCIFLNVWDSETRSVPKVCSTGTMSPRWQQQLQLLPQCSGKKRICCP